MSDANSVPEGFHTVTAYLIVPNAVDALSLYSRAFDAHEIYRLPGPGGQGTLHAEMQIGDSRVMLSDENPEWNARSPNTLGGTPVTLHLYVEDADAVFEQALTAGCSVNMPLADMFWGDRYGKVMDPFGHIWGIATHKEDVPPEEMASRAAKMFEGGV